MSRASGLDVSEWSVGFVTASNTISPYKTGSWINLQSIKSIYYDCCFHESNKNDSGVKLREANLKNKKCHQSEAIIFGGQPVGTTEEYTAGGSSYCIKSVNYT